MALTRNVVYAELKNGRLNFIPVQTISFKEGDVQAAFTQIEEKKKALMKKRHRRIAFCALTTTEGEVVFSNDDFDCDLY